MAIKSDNVMARLRLRQEFWRERQLTQSGDDDPVTPFRELLELATGQEMTHDAFVDTCAEARAFAEECRADQLGQECSHVQSHGANTIFSPFVTALLSELATANSGARDDTPQSAVTLVEPLHLYEQFLSQHNPGRRAQHGVFYTPRWLARRIVRQADATLRQQFGLADGLADVTTWETMQARCPSLAIPSRTHADEPFVRILDPAAGSGVFLIETIDHIHGHLQRKWSQEGADADQRSARWNEYVPRHLLPRLFAIELMPAPSLIAQIAIARRLEETGYAFHSPESLRFCIADALLDPTRIPTSDTQDPLLASSIATLRDTLLTTPFTVILGNPPFRGISHQGSPWMTKLLRGRSPWGARVASYYEADGKPLGERKLWLQDDYIKFLRYAQWRIERAGAGLVAFVTNHGYLDNATFRGVRHALLETFPRIDVLDLHGNRKKCRTAPDGGVDESVFEVEQGVAIGVLSRPPQPISTCVTHAEVWGTREAKLLALTNANDSPTTRLYPVSPDYLFVPQGNSQFPEYSQGFSLPNVMPVNSTAVVTARDGFVVGLNEDDLLERMNDFRDPHILDAVIRDRYFQNSRSTKYPPGDTRGWKLAAARQRMRDDPHWRSHIRPCLYRPFDRRVIYWADWMIDWPRTEVTRHLLGCSNLALVARRQMPPGEPCSYFWITQTIALDGLIRSDNRGSESLFPLWLDGPAPATPTVNLSAEFIAAVERRLLLRWDATGNSTATDRFGPHDVLYFIYALFHCPTYRERYAVALRTDFPRVVLPSSQSLWKSFCDVGRELVELHLFLPPTTTETEQPPWPRQVDGCSGSTQVVVRTPGFPKYRDGRIWVGLKGPAYEVPEKIWEFRVGAHQVCRKWLRDRQQLSTSDLEAYTRLLAAVNRTLELTERLEEHISQAGGWLAEFSA